MNSNKSMMNSTAHKANTTSKSIIYSPVSKNKVNKPVATGKMIERITQRLFGGKPSLIGNEQRQNQKTMAELVKEFHQKTRVYDEKENPIHSKWKSFARCIPKSPKLLSVTRNRPRNVLSQLEQEDLIAENIKKNTFKANPINKKIFEKKPSTLNNQTLNKPEHKPIRVNEFKFRTDDRLDARKQKDEKDHDNAGRFVFKARPMPHFKPIPIQTRTLKKQNSATSIQKQVSDVKINSKIELNKPQTESESLEVISTEPATIEEPADEVDSIAPVEPDNEQQVEALEVLEDRSADEPQEQVEKCKEEQIADEKVEENVNEQEQLSANDIEPIEQSADETVYEDLFEQNEQEMTFQC